MFATTFDGHKTQVPTSSGGGILVDSETVSPEKDPVLVSAISATLHSNGDLVLSASTIQGGFPLSSTLAAKNPLAVSFSTTVDGHKIQVPESASCLLVDSDAIFPWKDPVR